MIAVVRAGHSPAQLSSEFGVTAQSLTSWVDQVAIDDGKPLPDKESLTTSWYPKPGNVAPCWRQNMNIRLIRNILKLSMQTSFDYFRALPTPLPGLLAPSLQGLPASRRLAV